MMSAKRDRKSLLTTGSLHSLQPQHSYSNPAFSPSLFQSQNLPEFSRRLLPSRKASKHLERAILKNGDCNIYHTNIMKLAVKYLHDIFTSLVDIQWRWTLMIFALAYFVSWLFFALIWWLIMFTHGDLEDEHLPDSQAENNWNPCVLGIHNFTSCYLFSLETQYTIGYGVRTTTEECPQAIFIMSMQAIIGMTIDAFFGGIVFAKMTRPKLRTQTILLSRNAVVNIQDGDLCLMFRVGDMRKSPLVGAAIRAQLIKPFKSKEGEEIENYRYELNLNIDGGDNIFLLWPMNVVHKIDKDSPLYKYTASDLLQANIEILVVLEGTVESTGQSIQARSSYVSNEILWGYKFEPIVDHLKYEDAYDVNYSKFDNVYPVDIPLCSACELEAVDNQQQKPESSKSQTSPSSFEDDDSDEDAEIRRPPPPRPRARSVPRMSRPRGTYDDNPLIEFTSSYV